MISEKEETEQELAGLFGIQSIPSLLFVPKKGKPRMAAGAMPKNAFVQAINEILLSIPGSLPLSGL